jgi:hypothetical protein
MSFSFSAAGTKIQTLDALAQVTRDHDAAAQPVADLLIEMVGAGPEESIGHDGQVYDVIYTISAYGHTSDGSGTPSLGVTLCCTTRPKAVDERGGIEVDPDPADVR